MRVLIDTNIILDVLYKREPFYKDSLTIFKLCEIGKIQGFVSALSVADIVYILRKELDKEKIKNIVNALFLIFTIDDLKSEDLKNALLLGLNDYEDALQNMCAKRNKLDYIITRNKKDFLNSSIEALTPVEFLKL